MMRRLMIVIFVLACTLSADVQQVPSKLPTDGNDLLEYCGQVVSLMDDHSIHTNELEVGWCMGYVQGTLDLLTTMQSAMGVPFAERKTKGPFGICVPDEVSPAQVARVLVKGLRDHPEMLHQNRNVLTMANLLAAFPCEPAEAPKKEPQK